MASGESGHLLHNLLLFGHLLRRLGLNVHEGRMVDAVSVLEDIGVTRRADVWSALRTLLVHRKDDLPVFDEAFEVFWRQRKDRMSSLDLRSMGEQRRYRRVEAGPPPPGQSADDSDLQDQDPDEQYDRIDLTRTFSAREVLREKDFTQFTTEETLQARQLMAELQWNPGTRRTRRRERGRGPALDVRRTLAGQRAVRRRVASSEDAATEGEGPQAGGHLRRERLHGALHPDAAPLHPQPLRGP